MKKQLEVRIETINTLIAVAFAKKANVIGFDVDKEKIEIYKSGIEPTKEVGDEDGKLAKELNEAYKKLREEE